MNKYVIRLSMVSYSNKINYSNGIITLFLENSRKVYDVGQIIEDPNIIKKILFDIGRIIDGISENRIILDNSKVLIENNYVMFMGSNNIKLNLMSSEDISVEKASFFIESIIKDIS